MQYSSHIWSMDPRSSFTFRSSRTGQRSFALCTVCIHSSHLSLVSVNVDTDWLCERVKAEKLRAGVGNRFRVSNGDSRVGDVDRARVSRCECFSNEACAHEHIFIARRNAVVGEPVSRSDN